MMEVDGNLSKEYSFDLEKSLQPYRGLVKLYRLLFIVENPNTTKFREQAVKGILEEVLKTSNITFLQKLIEENRISSTQITGEHKEWLLTNEKNFQLTQNLLEQELISAKSLAIKDTIRNLYAELGNCFLQYGRLEEAMKQFLKARDYCTLPKHHIQISFSIVWVSFLLKQYYNVKTFLQKILEMTTDEALINKVKLLLGVVYLQDGKYEEVNKTFLELSYSALATPQNEFPSWLNDTLIGASDIGIYTVLTGLLALPFKSIQKQLLDNKKLWNYGLNTPENTFVKEFCAALKCHQYGKIQGFLEKVHLRCAYDPYISNRIPSMITMIQENMMIYYLVPYEQVSLLKMSEDFGMPLLTLRQYLKTLILSKQLPYRMNLQTNILLKYTPNIAALKIMQTMQLVEKQVVMQKQNVLRISVLQHNLVVEAPPQAGGGGSSGGAGSSGNIHDLNSGISMVRSSSFGQTPVVHASLLPHAALISPEEELYAQAIGRPIYAHQRSRSNEEIGYDDDEGGEDDIEMEDEDAMLFADASGDMA